MPTTQSFFQSRMEPQADQEPSYGNVVGIAIPVVLVSVCIVLFIMYVGMWLHHGWLAHIHMHLTISNGCTDTVCASAATVQETRNSCGRSC